MTTATRMKAATEVVAPDYLAKAYDQRVELRRDAIEILEALAKGLTRWQEVPWQWDPKDMAATNPDDWRRCAKIALLFAQLDAVRHALDWQASTRPLAPLWCVDCDGDFPGAPYLKWECLQHDSTPRSAADWAEALWGTR